MNERKGWEGCTAVGQGGKGVGGWVDGKVHRLLFITQNLWPSWQSLVDGTAGRYGDADGEDSGGGSRGQGSVYQALRRTEI